MPRCKANIDLLRGYRIKIYPTEDQIIPITHVINSYRAIYNIALGIQNDNYDNGNPYIKYFDMCKIFSDMRNNDPNYRWFSSIHISTIREALRNLDNAFKNFFNKTCRYPRFKSRKKSKKFFCTRSERTYIRGSYIYISEIGLIYADNHPIPEGVRLYNTGISFDGYDYWFYCQVEKEKINSLTVFGNPIGIDVGIRNMITTSEGVYYHFSDTSKLEKRLKRQQRRLQKSYNRYLEESMRTKTKYEDIPKSKNMQKRLRMQFKTYQKIKHKKYNDIHTATKEIVESYPSIIVIEDIKVSDQLKQSWSKKFAPNMLYYEIHRQLIYKAQDRSIPVMIADKDFPSSQICSKCGFRHKVYGNHKFICPNCGLKIDRDYNASINLSNLAYA